MANLPTSNLHDAQNSTSDETLTRQKSVLVVGAGWDQTPIIKEARSQGYRVVALDGDPTAHGLTYADRACIVSTRDSEGVLSIARQEKIDAVTYLLTESPLIAIRHVCGALGLPGPSHASVQITVNKARMREIFSNHGIPTPPFAGARTLEDAQAAATRIGFPLVMKPADSGGQYGLHLVQSLHKLPDAFSRALQASVAGEIVLESFLDGEEVNVVAVVLSGRIVEMIVSDRHKHAAKSFGVVIRHLYPAACLPESYASIQGACQQAVEAMGIRDGIIFPQMIITKQGPMFVEIGERVPGGLMKEVFELATGIDLVKLQLDISFGKNIDPERYRLTPAHPAVTVKFLTADPGLLKPGKVAKVLGTQEAMAQDGIVEVQFYNDPTKPQEVRPLCNGRDRFYHIIATGATREEVVARSNRAADCLDFLDENGASLRCASALVEPY